MKLNDNDIVACEKLFELFEELRQLDNKITK